MSGKNGEYTRESTVEKTNGNIHNDLYKLKKSVQQNVRVPDALRVTPHIPKQKIIEPKTVVVSGEFSGEKKGGAPGEKYSIKTCKEFNYLSLHRKLSYDEYEKLFTGFVNVRQGSLGDCYLVSIIRSLARSRFFDTLMMTSIEKNRDNSYNLYLPLGSPSGNKIHISKEELDLARIKGSDGYKILEVGFAKKELLKKLGFTSSTRDTSDVKLTKKSMEGIVGGTSIYALAVLLGYHNIKRRVFSNTPIKKEAILSKLRKFDPKNLDLIIVSSNRRPKNVPNSQKSYTVGSENMYYHHTYSLYAVEKKGNIIKSVILEDPLDSKKKILPLNRFMSAFSTITTCSPQEGFLSA